MTHEYGTYAFAKWRERRHAKNLDKWQNRKKEDSKESNDKKVSRDDKKIEKYQSKLDAQSAANANLDAYRKHHSAVELGVQNIGGALLGVNGPGYRAARARGEGALRSLVEGGALGLYPVSMILKFHGNKEKYGKYIVWGAMETKNSIKT